MKRGGDDTTLAGYKAVAKEVQAEVEESPDLLSIFCFWYQMCFCTLGPYSMVSMRCVFKFRAPLFRFRLWGGPLSVLENQPAEKREVVSFLAIEHEASGQVRLQRSLAQVKACASSTSERQAQASGLWEPWRNISFFGFLNISPGDVFFPNSSAQLGVSVGRPPANIKYRKWWCSFRFFAQKQRCLQKGTPKSLSLKKVNLLLPALSK